MINQHYFGGLAKVVIIGLVQVASNEDVFSGVALEIVRLSNVIGQLADIRLSTGVQLDAVDGKYLFGEVSKLRDRFIWVERFND